MFVRDSQHTFMTNLSLERGTHYLSHKYIPMYGVQLLRATVYMECKQYTVKIGERMLTWGLSLKFVIYVGVCLRFTQHTSSRGICLLPSSSWYKVCKGPCDFIGDFFDDTCRRSGAHTMSSYTQTSLWGVTSSWYRIPTGRAIHGCGRMSSGDATAAFWEY